MSIHTYEAGDVVRYSRGSKALKIKAGEYARVSHVDPKENRITIEREKGTMQTYDPRRLSGVSVHREVEHEFSKGDRIQFTAPSKELKVANRELGTIESVSSVGDLSLRLDSGREVRFNIREHAHLDHGYAVTSHSSQGQTADRVLIHVDTGKSELLVNNRFAYVSVSRAQYDAQIYTNDGSKLSHSLSRESSQRTAAEETLRLSHVSPFACYLLDGRTGKPRCSTGDHAPQQDGHDALLLALTAFGEASRARKSGPTPRCSRGSNGNAGANAGARDSSVIEP
jgi:hypothetical protein